MRPLWALPGPELLKQLQGLDKERERQKRWDSSAVGKFINLANREFPHTYGDYRHFQNRAVVQYEPLDPVLSEDHSDLGQVVLIRLVYVIERKRGNKSANSEYEAVR